MRIPIIVLAAALIAGTASRRRSPAQRLDRHPGPHRAGHSHRRPHRTVAERFDAANTALDGHLTMAQARAGHTNAVVRDSARDQREYDEPQFAVVEHAAGSPAAAFTAPAARAPGRAGPLPNSKPWKPKRANRLPNSSR